MIHKNLILKIYLPTTTPETKTNV